jgi:hypothetical protein
VSGDPYSCQAIPILDAGFEENRFGAVLTALSVNPAPDAAAKTVQTERLENIQSLKVLKEKLDEHTWLRDRYGSLLVKIGNDDMRSCNEAEVRALLSD